jgi:hypothetical protein
MNIIKELYDYEVASHYHLYDERLSLEAKGFLSYIFSAEEKYNDWYNGCDFWDYFDDWENWYDDNDHINYCNFIETKRELYNILKALEQFKYLKHSTEEDEGELIHYYQIFEKPYEG